MRLSIRDWSWRRLPGQLIEKLVEALHSREHPAPARHEAVDVGPPARRLLAQEPVEIAQHLPDGTGALGAHPLEPLLQLAEEALVHLLAQSQHELLELLPGLGIDELVALEPADRPAQVLRQCVELRATLGCDPLELPVMGLRRGIPGRCRLPRAVDPAVDSLPLGVEHVLELPTEIPEDVAEVVPV